MVWDDNVRFTFAVGSAARFFLFALCFFVVYVRCTFFLLGTSPFLATSMTQSSFRSLLSCWPHVVVLHPDVC